MASKSFVCHLTVTIAPFVLMHLVNLTFAFILSNNVLPINVPRPRPDLELIILFSPLLGAIVVGFFWRSIGERQAIYLTIALLFLSCFLSWIVFLSHGSDVEKITLFRWINSGDLSANWSIRLDRLTSIMLVVVTSVSALVHLYSVGYMAHDENWKEVLFHPQVELS